MRGPGVRLKNDVRRTWKCPYCGKERKLGKEHVSLSCRCTTPPAQMQLIEPRRAVRAEMPPLPLYFDCEELLAEEPSIADPSSPGRNNPPVPTHSQITAESTLTVVEIDENAVERQVTTSLNDVTEDPAKVREKRSQPAGQQQASSGNQPQSRETTTSGEMDADI